ncbi:hypothetical protein BSLG_002587 [Batrachochytrium salamandrivorans]|nr:hypothetical protein BSLG_002587 [Batrachochytrium salamandrivorans]
MSSPAAVDLYPEGNSGKPDEHSNVSPPSVVITGSGRGQTPSPPIVEEPNMMWKVIGSPARRASIIDNNHDVLAAMTSQTAGEMPAAGGKLPSRAFRNRAQSTPNHQLGDSNVDSDAPPGFGPSPQNLHHNGAGSNGLYAPPHISKMDNSCSLTGSPSGKASWAASLSAEKAFLESDLPSRHFRSLSFAVSSEQANQQLAASENFRSHLGDMTLPTSLETSELTEEEYAAMPKTRSRSKSSSAIYGNHPDEMSGSMPPNSSQIPDMSSIWRDVDTDRAHDPMMHRRSSTQPSHQAYMWEAMRSSNLATFNDMNGINTEELLERYRQQQTAQMRRYSVAPSVLNRFISSHIDTVDIPSSNVEYDANRRRHSLGGPSLEQQRKNNARTLKEGINTLGINDQIEEIDDYFENTENRVRAWAEAGKNLQMNHTPESPVSAVSPAPRQLFRFPLYVVEFKAGRVDYFYVADGSIGVINVGDLAIVEADRGKDLGKVIDTGINSFQDLQLYQATHPDALVDSHLSSKEIYPKRVFRLAQGQEIGMLLSKGQDEAKAMGVCQVKIRQRKLAMEIVDAEYQWDRRKLTFYFVAERRVDFRELVRELFKIFKMRIWMCAVNPMRQE